jgi:hypothetical protein
MVSREIWINMHSWVFKKTQIQWRKQWTALDSRPNCIAHETAKQNKAPGDEAVLYPNGTRNHAITYTKNILKKLSCCYHDNYFKYFMFGKDNGFVRRRGFLHACIF